MVEMLVGGVVLMACGSSYNIDSENSLRTVTVHLLVRLAQYPQRH